MSEELYYIDIQQNLGDFKQGKGGGTEECKVCTECVSYENVCNYDFKLKSKNFEFL